jgi:deazaflavin-dependent oxidoreductase (nitroreductase family)
MTDQTFHYQQPGRMTGVFNRLTGALAGLGISLAGSRLLEVKGRSSGQPRRTPVNPLDHAGHHYLVSARGQTQWVRNVRADGGRLTLILGRRRTAYRTAEISGPDQIPVLRAYLRRWSWEVGAFFGGVGADSTDAELAAVAADHPVFELLAPA